MPPFLMLLAVAFVVVMMVFGNNPVDQWRAEQEKYGKDPLAREINKYNEEQSKLATGAKQYKPPPGAMLYQLPADQAQIVSRNPYSLLGGQDNLVRPAPDIPISQWSNPYPSYMISPDGNTNPATGRPSGGTSLMPGSATSR